MTPASTPATRSSGAALLVVMLLGVFAGGCAVQTRSSARRVAYDYSDHQHYNRPHAPSPSYRSAADHAAARAQPMVPLQRYGVRDSAGRNGAARNSAGHHPALGYITTVLIPPAANPAAERSPAEAEATGRGGHRPTAAQAGRAPATREGRRAVLRQRLEALMAPSR